MGTKLTVTIDLERELDDGRLQAGDLVELLCADLPWAKASLTVGQQEQLVELVAYCGGILPPDGSKPPNAKGR